MRVTHEPMTSAMTSSVSEGTPQRRPARRKLFFHATLVVAPVSLIALSIYYLLPILKERELSTHPEQIVVIGFENRSGDRKLDYLRNVLQDAAITDLEQSKYFQVTTRERMTDILRQMGKGNPEYIDIRLGRDVCRNVGAEIMAVGAFTRVGDQFQTSLDLVDANNLGVIQSSVSSGTGQESLLRMQIEQLVSNIPRGFGISSADTTREIHPIAEAMTSSPEAYDFVLRGVDACDRMNHKEARRFFEKAVQKDSTFTMAWYWLAIARKGAGDDDGAGHAQKKASLLADRVTEKEKSFIAVYDSSLRVRLIGPSGTDDLEFLRSCTIRFPLEKHFWFWLGSANRAHGDIDSAIVAQKKVLDLDPTFVPSLAELAYAYDWQGDLESSVEVFQRWATAAVGDPRPYNVLAEFYWRRGMPNEAIATFEKAIDVERNWDPGYSSIAAIYLQNEQYDQAIRWVDSGITRASSSWRKTEAMWQRACYLYWLGRLKDAEKEIQKRASVLDASGREPQTDAYMLKSWIAYDRRDYRKSRMLFRKWAEKSLLERSDGTINWYLPELETEFSLGLVDLKVGKLDSVEFRLSRMEEARSRAMATIAPEDSAEYLRKWQERHGLLAAYLQLARGNPREALALAPSRQNPHSIFLAASFPTTRSDITESPLQMSFVPMPQDLVPAAYLAMGKLDSAIVTYERAVSPRSTIFDPIVPRYHYRLARIYEQAGMKDKAMVEYRKFLKIWGKADRVFKEPKEAKRRLSRLQKEERHRKGTRGRNPGARN